MLDLQLSFHGNIALKKEDLIKILRAAQEEQGLQDTERLANRTNLGEPKVESMKGWVSRSGLVEENFLSPPGKVVMEKDPFLQSPVTDWLIHFYLSFGNKGLISPPESPAQWGGWTWFVYEFIPKHYTFTKSEVIHYAKLKFKYTSEKALAKNFNRLLDAYNHNDALSGIQYIQRVGKDQYSTENPELPSPYLMGYCLALLWERDFTGATSILTQNLWEQHLGFATVFNLSESQFQKALNDLEYTKILEQRREVPPFQLIRRWQNPLDLLDKAYTI